MAGKLVRYQQTGDFHFVTFSCYRRQPLLSTAPVRELFEQSLETMRKRYGFFVSGCVVMPEHVHILLSEPKNCGLDKAIRR
jgi:putative transposase